MNKKTSPTLIGAFVVGAVVLLVIAVIAFGSGRLFQTEQRIRHSTSKIQLTGYASARR